MTEEEGRARGHALLDPIAADYLAMPDVDIGPMFGSEGLRVRGKVFAFVTSHGLLALKLPETRVDELAGDDGMLRMTMRERSMREWLTVPRGAPERWRPLVAEAHAFVDSITP